MKYTHTPGALLILFSVLAQAELTAVEDLSSTPTLPYYRTLNLPTEHAPSKATHIPPVRLHPYSEADMLPVRSERLTPGKIVKRESHNPGIASIFLIGDDEFSHQWLASRKDILKKLNAVGLVVNVQRIEALTALREIGSGLEMVPVSADELAERLGIQHYPLLITATGIEQ